MTQQSYHKTAMVKLTEKIIRYLGLVLSLQGLVK